MFSFALQRILLTDGGEVTEEMKTVINSWQNPVFTMPEQVSNVVRSTLTAFQWITSCSADVAAIADRTYGITRRNRLSRISAQSDSTG